MSDLSPSVLFEHPLNEKMRTWLRIEFLLQQLHQYPVLRDIATCWTFWSAVKSAPSWSKSWNVNSRSYGYGQTCRAWI
jgi:hypothetical protein